MKYSPLNVVNEIPGGWYGNNPTLEYQHGHVIVDPKRLRDAFAWIQKSRRYWILDTSLTTDNGISIGLQLKTPATVRNQVAA